MFILGYFLMAVARVLDYVLLFFMLVILARAVLSWVSPDPYNPIVRFIHSVTEPVLYRIRRIIPMAFGGIDFSPIVVFLGIVFLREFLVNSLLELSRTLF
ncbi:MAG: YggT family protein [Pseudomonadota bacterium]